MRLLNSSTYTLEEFDEDELPPYAITSYTWDPTDSYLNYSGNLDVRESTGFAKIRKFCHCAQDDKIDYIWTDSCCLDASNQEEVSRSLNSVYEWFENSVVCYVYLADVSFYTQLGHIKPKWFTRIWTLQELVAPPSVKFFASNWRYLGTRFSLQGILSEITNIQGDVLNGLKKPKSCHVSERLGWASNRTTTRVEDRAYAILGLFDIKMPILYGEGERAFQRLQEQISRTHYASVLDTSRIPVRLLETKSNPLRLKSFRANEIPTYAILSHTWGSPDDEVLFSDFSQNKAEKKREYRKVWRSCQLAASHGFEYVWIDTCCIDKSSSAELQEAICSMYMWYKNSRICYVYLEDYSHSSQNSSFRECRWFTRGWTLQELIAPQFVEFYDKNWNSIGTKSSMCQLISEITTIEAAVLRGADPADYTVAERMSWAASRSTTRIEDAAYSLMGLFNVFMPMLYGEGNRAFSRLQEEIMKQCEDYSIFAWKATILNNDRRGMLAHSPDEFLGFKRMSIRGSDLENPVTNPPVLTSRGLQIELWLKDSGKGYWFACIGSLNIKKRGTPGDTEKLVCIQLQEIPSQPSIYMRIRSDYLEHIPSNHIEKFRRKRIFVQPFGTVEADKKNETKQMSSGTILVYQKKPLDLVYLEGWPWQSGANNPDVEWVPDADKLLYSYERNACIVAAFHFIGSGDQALIIIGFRSNSPWCHVRSITRSEGLGALQKKLHNLDFMSRLADRSEARLSPDRFITVAIRPGASTSLDLTVFNLQIDLIDTHVE